MIVNPRGAQPVKVANLNTIAIVPCDWICRVGTKVEHSEFHLGRINRQDPSDQWLAQAKDDLDGFERLNRTNDAGKDTEYASLST